MQELERFQALLGQVYHVRTWPVSKNVTLTHEAGAIYHAALSTAAANWEKVMSSKPSSKFA